MTPPRLSRRRRAAGFTLVELMISMTISLVILASLVGLFVNLSRSHREMDKLNGVIENGRIAMQLLEDDLVHAGYWGGHVPRFDDFSATELADDVPGIVTNPCTPWANWDSGYRTALLGTPVITSDTLWAGAGCTGAVAQRAGTDVLLVRHAETCAAGAAGCAAEVAGTPYLQVSWCAAERNAGTVQGAFATSVGLDANASNTNGAYTGVAIRIVSGKGAGQVRFISAYNGGTHVATLANAWTIVPDGTSVYAFDLAFGTASFPLHERDCAGTGSPVSLPVTAGTLADKRRLISDLYYVADRPHPDRAGEWVPTLMRSRLQTVGGGVVQAAPQELVEGVESLRFELGIDDSSKTGEVVDYTKAIEWDDPDTKARPRNRGDGAPDRFIRCTTAAPCSATDLANVVAIRIHALVRSREPSADFTDTRSYCLGDLDADGDCPAEVAVAAANDHYKRHVYQSSVRLVNVSGRRESP